MVKAVDLKGHTPGHSGYLIGSGSDTLVGADGVDTASRRANYQNTIEKVEESGALVYPIKYDTENDQQGSSHPSASPWPWPTPHPPNRRRWPFGNLAWPVFQQWPGRSPSVSTGWHAAG